MSKNIQHAHARHFHPISNRILFCGLWTSSEGSAIETDSKLIVRFLLAQEHGNNGQTIVRNCLKPSILIPLARIVLQSKVNNEGKKLLEK